MGSEDPATGPGAAPWSQGYLDLVDWRRHVGDLYRITGPDALRRFREGRDDLFRTHPQSPIEPEERATFSGLHYFDHDPNYRVQASVENGDGSELIIDTGGDDGEVRYKRIGTLNFTLKEQSCTLTVLSLVQYAGGLFVPFRDSTSGHETYGGGRYLFDTAKDTDGLVLDFTAGSPDVVIDFNFAYNASCAYSPRWACPLAPPENHLKVAVRAGEKLYKTY
jgi:uncharacterized protein (DUF1684 family)